MELFAIVLLSSVLLLIGYFTYGSFLSKFLNLRPDIKTPAYTQRDDIDYVPTNKFYLLGQHFSAISAAGPIVGPILAGMWFGWFPAILWIIFGSIFIGGVHDMLSLVASIRHKGRSIAEVIKEYKTKRAFIIFLLFLWFSLVYIITAFTDITAGTFADAIRGPAVASSSMMYLLLALIMGTVIKRFNPPLLITTLIFLPMVFVCIYLGPLFPLSLKPFLGMDVRTVWDILLLSYCFVAAVIPVWLLLQPRGYLGGFFLTMTVVVSFIGILIGSFTQHYTVNFPYFSGWVSSGGLPLFPILFTTIACGACSGFHALVSSGTTSKQLSKETDAKMIGYGGLLLESFVAIIALATLMLLTKGQMKELGSPDQIYANGIATFLNSLGINKEFALNFALLAFATFVYDTLDVATRLGRYIFQELTGMRGKVSMYLSALATLILPVILVTRKILDADGNVIPAWKVFWSVFGASNQLLAAIVLLAVSVWLFRKGKKILVSIIPSIFMFFIAIASLIILLFPWIRKIASGRAFAGEPIVITVIALLILSVLLIIEAMIVFSKGRKSNG